MDIVLETDFAELGKPKRGKVRDVYDLGETLVIVTTDRISAFDSVLPTGIPNKGMVLNTISLFWFDKIKDLIDNHIIESDPLRFPEAARTYAAILRDRAVWVKKARSLPIECVVRGYLTGYGWDSYRKTGSVCGVKLPTGLVESEKLPEPIFTPTTKAESGHDEPVTLTQAGEIIGHDLAKKISAISIEIYQRAASIAEKRGIIIADTKFEFGLLGDKLIIIDEILTPDSSRFWPAEGYVKGRSQSSYDKQYVRDYLLAINWDKNPPAPPLPADVAAKTAEKYLAAKAILTAE